MISTTRTTASHRLKYICPQCLSSETGYRSYNTIQQNFNPRFNRSSRTKQKLYQNLHQNRRNAFSNSTRINKPEVATTQPADSPEDFSYIRKTIGGVTVGQTSPKNSVIRDQLRAWSIQKQREKKENAPEDVPPGIRGVSIALPSSLFIEDSKLETPLSEEDEILAEYDQSLEGSNKLMLEPGDLTVQGSRIVRKQMAIFLGMAGTQYHFLLSDGRWLVETVSKNYSVQLHNFASEAEIARVKEYLPKKEVSRENTIGMKGTVSAVGEVPPEVSKPLLDRIAQLIDDISIFRRNHIAQLDSIYDRFAHETEHNFMRIRKVAEELFNTDFDSLSNAGKMSLLAAAHEDNLRIQLFEPPGQDNLHIIFTPKALTKKFNQVVEWARQYQECAADAALGKDVRDSIKHNPLSLFIDKARRLILKSRNIRSPTTIGSLGPSSIQSFSGQSVKIEKTGESYSETDKMILEFLWNAYLRQPAPKYRNRFHSIASLILRGIGAYPKLKLENKIGRLLLQELGSLAPWAEMSDDSVILPLPGRRGAHGAQKLFDDSEALAESLGFSPHISEVPLPDTMADLRKDWGTLEVFCVDKPSSEVIDDGYSIQPSSDVPGAYWIHCHVAHPSAYIAPDHLFAQRARLQGQSLYTSRRVYAMMPWNVIKRLSLKPGEPALTVSTLLNEQGDVLDIQICASKVNNIIYLEKRAVTQLMGTEDREAAFMVVGSDSRFQAKHVDEETKEATNKVRPYLPTLQKIQTLGQARIRARQREVPEYANFSHPIRDASSAVSFLEPYEIDRLVNSYHYHGDPTIKVVADRFERCETHNERYLNEDVTTHVMVLAGESAGKWFRDRQISACFNGTLTHPEFPLSKLNNAKPGTKSLVPVGGLHSSPVPHVLLNLAQYLKMTSPLRRYTDLIAGWQIDSYLRAEAESQFSKAIPDKQKQPRFSKADIDNYLQEQSHVLRTGDHAIKKARLHWTFQALFRAFHFKEAELPPVWDFKASTVVSTKQVPEETGIRGRLQPFDLTATLLESTEKWEDQQGGVKFEQYIPVKIEMVDVTQSVVYVRAVGPPSPTVTQLDPIRIESPRDEKKNNGTEAAPV